MISNIVPKRARSFMPLCFLLMFITALAIRMPLFLNDVVPPNYYREVPQVSLEAYTEEGPQTFYVVLSQGIPREQFRQEYTWGHAIVQEHLNDIRVVVNFPKVYELGTFDCSEMSAYLEWYFENQGMDTVICSDSHHSWIRIDNGEHGWINVESTKMLVALGNRWNNETTAYDSIYSTQYRADYDWWNTEYADDLEGILG